jgi:hypothetical protein
MSETKHSVAVTRKTSDGETVQIWTDGAVTIGHPCNNRLAARGLASALWFVVADDVCLYTVAEVRGLIAAARKAQSKIKPYGWLGHTEPVSETRRLMRAYT